MNWYVWRVVSSQKMRISLVELKTTLTFEDLSQAHAILDMLEDADISADQRLRQEAEAARTAGR